MNNSPASLFRRSLLVLSAVAAASCARREDSDFARVSETVLDRTGREIRWTRDEDARAAATTEITRLISAPLDADGAVQIALLNNRTLQARFEEIGLARAEVIQAGLLPNPLIHAGYQSSTNDGADPVIEIAVVQNLLELLTLPARRRITLDRLESVKAGTAEAVLSLASEVRAQFLAVQADEESLALMNQAVMSAAAAAEVSGRLREAGNITATDHARHLAAEGRARLNLAAAELSAMKERERLNILMGLWGDQLRLIIPAGFPDLAPEEIDLEEIERRAVESNFTLRAMEHELDAAARAEGLAKATALIPELDGGAVFSREEDGNRLLGPTLGLSVPLFDQGRPRVRSARGRLRILQEEYWQKAVEIRAAARAARDHLLLARRRAEFSRSVTIPLAGEIMRQSMREFDGMQIGVFQLLEAREGEIQARLDHLSDLREYRTARIEVETLLQGHVTEFGMQITPLDQVPGSPLH